MTDLAGQYLGRYYLKERLGEGGMATVYKGYDTRLERDVAVKIIRSAAFPMEALDSVLKRFEREAKSLAKLSHPNIVKVYDYGEHDGSPYLVMEYLPGGTLKKFIGKPMNWQEAVRLLLPIARGVAYAHQRGILHRDIKPANILITEDGDPMLSDFGIAKLFEGEQTTALTGSGMAIGTPEYMAPEQWTGTTSIQSDLYSLGIVLYEMVAGRKPYMGDTPAAILIKQATEPLPSPRKFAVELPESLEDVLVKALAKEPEDRYTSIVALIRALENLQAGAPITHPPVEETHKVPPPKPEIPVPAKTAPLMEEDVHIIEDSPSSTLANTPMPSTEVVETPPQMPETKSIPVQVPAVNEGRTVKTFEPLSPAAREETLARPAPSSKKATPLKLSPRGIGLLVGGIFIVLAVWLGSPLIETWFSQPPVATKQSTATLALTTQAPNETKAATEVLPQSVLTGTASPTSSPFPAEITDAKNVPMVLVPEGDFLMGSNDGDTNESPAHRVFLDSYYIDKYEVTNALYKECVDAKGCDLPKNTTRYNLPEYSQHPVQWVYWSAAKRYCEWRGGRLPTEAEWEKAARGTDLRAYPWGSGAMIAYANYGNIVGDTTAVGSYPKGVSPYGAYDMAGNVEEWVSDWYAEKYYPLPASNPMGPDSADYRLLRGGSWVDGSWKIRVAFRHVFLPMATENYHVGFRCALSVDVATPGSVTQTPLSAGILFYDDFEGAEQVYSYSPSGSGLAFTTVVPLDDDHHNVLKAEPAEPRNIKFGEYSWKNYVVEFDFMLSGKIRKDPDAWFAVIMRADSASQYEQYVSFFSLRDDHLVHAYQQCPARCLEVEAITSVTTYIRTDLWYHIRVEISNGIMSTYVNDVLQLRTSDSRITNGKPGFDFSCCTGLTYYFDNIQVKEIK